MLRIPRRFGALILPACALLFALTLGAPSYAAPQPPVPNGDVRITVDAHQVPLGKLLKQFAALAHVEDVTIDQSLENILVSVKLDGVTPAEAFRAALADAGADFAIAGTGPDLHVVAHALARNAAAARGGAAAPGRPVKETLEKAEADAMLAVMKGQEAAGQADNPAPEAQDAPEAPESHADPVAAFLGRGGAPERRRKPHRRRRCPARAGRSPHDADVDPREWKRGRGQARPRRGRACRSSLRSIRAVSDRDVGDQASQAAVMRRHSAGILALAVALATAAPTFAQSPKTSDLPARDAVVEMTLEKTDEAALRARVASWWAARVKRDHQAMYDLFEPAYRAKTNFSDFATENTTRSRFDLSDPEVLQVVAESPTRAKVLVQFKGMVSIIGQSFPSKVEEAWVKVDEKWYKVHQPTITSILTPPSP
jgi:hypothetical protein